MGGLCEKDKPHDQKLNFMVVDTSRTYKIAFHTCLLYMKAHFIHNFLTVGHFMCPMSDTINEIFNFGTNFLL